MVIPGDSKSTIMQIAEQYSSMSADEISNLFTGLRNVLVMECHILIGSDFNRSLKELNINAAAGEAKGARPALSGDTVNAPVGRNLWYDTKKTPQSRSSCSFTCVCPQPHALLVDLLCFVIFFISVGEQGIYVCVVVSLWQHVVGQIAR
jgi:hypothetical protein